MRDIKSTKGNDTLGVLSSLQLLTQATKENDMTEKEVPDNYTYIDEGAVWVCNDCGAVSSEIKNIQHYGTCVEGNSEKWQKFYENARLNEQIEELELRILEAKAKIAAENTRKEVWYGNPEVSDPTVMDSLKVIKRFIKRELSDWENQERYDKIGVCLDAMKFYKKLEAFVELSCDNGWLL